MGLIKTNNLIRFFKSLDSGIWWSYLADWNNIYIYKNTLSTLVPVCASLVNQFFFILERILVLEVFLEVFLRVRSILIEEASKKKLLVILGLNLTIMQTTTVKRSKLTNDTLAARANQPLLLLLLFFLIFFFSGKVNSGKLFDCITNLFPHGWWKGNTITTSHTWSSSKTWCVQFDDYNIAESFNDSSLQQSNYIP